MSRELVERLRERSKFRMSMIILDKVAFYEKSDVAVDNEAADLIERQDILIKEMAETLQNMALSLNNEETKE